MNIYQMNLVVDVFGQGQSGTPIGTVGDACPYKYEWRIGRRRICWGDSRIARLFRLRDYG